MTHVLVLVGSERQGFNAALAATAISLLPAGATAQVVDDLGSLPHYREELDASGVNATVDSFRELVKGADALLLVTPEYNGGPSSLIKNALDVASRPQEGAAIRGKPVAVVGATPSPGGTAGARDVLRRGVPIAGGKLVEATMGVARAYQYLGPDGYAPEVQSELQGVLNDLVRATEPAPVL